MLLICLPAAVSISVTRTGADEATICREYSPDDDRAAEPAPAADVMEALSEVDAARAAEGVPSMDDLLSPPTPPPLTLALSPDPEDEPQGVAAADGGRGVENMLQVFTDDSLSKNYALTWFLI